MVETSPSGHRLVYVRELIAKALDHNMSVVLATTDEVVRDPLFEQHLGSLKGSVELVNVRGNVTVWKLQQWATAACCDLVLVPDTLKYGPPLLLGWTRRSPIVRLLIMNDPRWRLSEESFVSFMTWCKLLVFFGSGARPGVEVLWLRPQGTAPSKGVVIDPLLLEASVERTRADSKRVRATLGMDPATFWFGIVGVLDSRKNIPLVANALRRVADQGSTPVGLALLGPWSDEIARCSADDSLHDAPFPVVRHHASLTNQEMNVAVAALDCVVMAYSTNAPNSTTAKAAALGVRVAVAGSAPFRRFAERLTGYPGVGLGANELVSELATSMRRPRPEPCELSGPEGLTDALLAPIPKRNR